MTVEARSGSAALALPILDEPRDQAKCEDTATDEKAGHTGIRDRRCGCQNKSGESEHGDRWVVGCWTR